MEEEGPTQDTPNEQAAMKVEKRLGAERESQESGSTYFGRWWDWG